jgi:hypothetical protein
MSVPSATVPNMPEENLASLGNEVKEFAASHDLVVVPAIPHHDLGPEVDIDPATFDLARFLELASAIGDGVVYLEAEPFDPDAEPDLVNDDMAHLTVHKGQTGEVCVAFAREGHGLLHFWEIRTAWYDQWQEQLGARPAYLATDDDEFLQHERLSEEEADRLASEFAASILEDPQFRAADKSSRRRVAELAVPEGTDRSVVWAAVRQACERADQMTRDMYAPIRPKLDELAAELLAAPEYQQSSSATAQKEAASQFLTTRFGGFSPPPLYRDELYAKAKRLARQGGGKALF